ncbi:MAG TPA: NTP transferase domain-containing protein [Solirubrobacteraceae bacterium]|jgi:2-phospho-L-lactate guanylyltransferase|nr:NTP transferase domain-containing protein [Solirubrobacteraceae bacterium]
MRTAAILPVKRFPLAKQRLGESVAESLRANLARAMVGDVLGSLRECPAIDATIVVTCEPSVAAAARYIDAIVVEDTAEEGQSAAASLGLAHALREGFERGLCVPGDCPTLDPGELMELLAADTPSADVGLQFGVPRARGEETKSAVIVQTEVVIVPDRHGKGTNGLLLSPPDALSPSFGPDSRARHERLATESGVKWRIARPASLLLDIDTGEDLAALRERLAGERVRAPRTRAVLARAESGNRASKATQTDPSTTTQAA